MRVLTLLVIPSFFGAFLLVRRLLLIGSMHEATDSWIDLKNPFDLPSIGIHQHRAESAFEPRRLQQSLQLQSLGASGLGARAQESKNFNRL